MGVSGCCCKPSALDHDAGFLEGVDDLAVEWLVAQLRIAALALAVLPRAAPLDAGGLRANRCASVSENSLGGESRLLILENMARQTKISPGLRIGEAFHSDRLRLPVGSKPPDGSWRQRSCFWPRRTELGEDGRDDRPEQHRQSQGHDRAH